MLHRYAILATLLASFFVSGHTGPLVRVQHQGDNVDLLLVLAADVSQSVDTREFLLQREGYANALMHPKVLRAISTSGSFGRIAVCYVEWSGPTSQSIVVDWSVISNRGEAARFAARLKEAPRPFGNSTSISAAIDFIMSWIIPESPYNGRRTVIDISGDGTNTSGRPVSEARDEAIRNGAVINGLVILDNSPKSSISTHTNPTGGLKKYFEANVVGGPGAFVQTAKGFDSFGQSIISKLIKEIALAPMKPHNRRIQ